MSWPGWTVRCWLKPIAGWRLAKLAALFAAGLIGGPQTEQAIDALVDQVGPGAAPRPHDVEPV